jgi:HEAT repeat protein
MSPHGNFERGESMIRDAWIPGTGGTNGEGRCGRRGGRDHRRESVDQTGAAANLGRQPDPRARRIARTCKAGGRSTRPNHVTTHVGIKQLVLALLAVILCAAPSPSGVIDDGPSVDGARSLIKDLTAENVEIRRAAAIGIRDSRRDVQRSAVPAMIDRLMKDPDGQVRLAVLDTLFALGHDAAPAIPALVHTLRTDFGGSNQESLHQDYRSALALGAIGKPAVEPLRGLLGEKKESVRAEVVMALGRVGPDAAPAVPDLVRLLGDKSERIRREAIVSLGRIGPAAARALIAASAEKDVRVRAGAVEALGLSASPDDETRRAVLEHAREGAPEVQAAAVKSLAKLGLPDDALLPVLKEVLRSQDERVRLAAIDLLVGRRVLLASMGPELDELLVAKDEGVSRHAAFLLGQSGADAIPRLLNALSRKESRIGQIADGLVLIGKPAVSRLTESLKNPDPRVRRGAALALGQIRPLAPGTAQQLTAVLKDPSPEVKGSVLTALGYLGPRARDSAPAVVALLHDPAAEIRIQAVRVLFQSAPHDDRMLEDFLSLIDDTDAKVQGQIIDTIRALGPVSRRALPRVIGKLNSTDLAVRIAAAEMIASHGPAAAEAVPALASLLDVPEPKLQRVAAETLGSLGKSAQPAFARLTSLLGSEHAEIRIATATTLCSLELEPEVLRPHLVRTLRDDNADVRRATLRAIQRLGAPGAIFVPDIIRLADGKENMRTVQRLLRRYERRGPDVRSLPELIQELKHDKEPVRLLAVRFLGLAGKNAKEAIPALERMREDPSDEVRKQALAASERIRGNAPPGQRKSREAAGAAED